MKIAVCVSGAFNTKYKDNSLLYEYDQKLRKMFPSADFYYATWSRFEEQVKVVLPDVSCEFFEEPKIHYHPYLDIDSKDYISAHYKKTVDWVRRGGSEKEKWTSHHTKQILIHALLVETISQKYDVYIKVRFDAYVSEAAAFDKYLNVAYTNGTVFGFGTHDPKQFGTAVDVTDTLGELKQKYFIYDALIIYPSKALDVQQIKTLHLERKLHAAEQGWCQVLSIIPRLSFRNISGLVSNNKYGHPDGK